MVSKHLSNLILLIFGFFYLSTAFSATINLRDADIRAFSADIAKISNKTIILDPRIKGNVSVISNSNLDPGEAYEVFLSVLRVHGFSAIENNGVVKVMPESGARQDSSTVKDVLDGFITETFRLKQANAKSLASILKPLVNKQGHIAAYEPTNTIIIADYSGNLSRIKKLLEEIDKDPAESFELIKLVNTSANEIARILGSIYKSSSENKRSFSIISVESSNSLLIKGQIGIINQLRGVITRLDSSTIPSSNLKVIYLKYANAEDLTPILKSVAESLESELINGDSKNKATTNISSHVETNSLVISARPDVLKSLENVISQLDIQRAQVLVEAIIVELSDRLSRDLGVQFLFAGDGRKSPVAIQKFGSTNPDIISIVGSQSNNSNSSLLQNNVAGTLLGIDGLALGVGKYQSGGESFGAIINLIAQDSDSNVLSTPSIMTMDNEEASIVVGQEIPITTGETLSVTNSNPFRSIQRQEVGIKLTVKPQINEGSAVKMYINQEVSSVSGPVIAGSSDLITNTRNIRTTVLVEDGATIVLGGLIDDDVQELESKVPVLGDIPILGRLFKSNSTTRTKRNLMVFLRPTIIRSTNDLDVISNRKYNYFEAMQEKMIKDGNETPDISILREFIGNKDVKK